MFLCGDQNVFIVKALENVKYETKTDFFPFDTDSYHDGKQLHDEL